jgi:hypothetical protein
MLTNYASSASASSYTTKEEDKSLTDILGSEIGRGGYGVVFESKNDKDMCVKVSDKTNSCRKWSDEFEKVTSVISKLETNEFYKKLNYVKIIKPTKYIIRNDGKCYMIMPRIFRPEAKNVKLPTINPQFGVKSYNKIYEGRGQFLGVEQISKNFINKSYRKEYMLKYSYELGILMALIHFVAKNDAYDIELYFGKESRKKNNRVYISDWDLSEKYDQLDDRVISRIAWSLDAVPYFPTLETKNLMEVFLEGYLEVCEKYSVSKEVIDKIFKNYG